MKEGVSIPAIAIVTPVSVFSFLAALCYRLAACVSVRTSQRMLATLRCVGAGGGPPLLFAHACRRRCRASFMSFGGKRHERRPSPKVHFPSFPLPWTCGSSAAARLCSSRVLVPSKSPLFWHVASRFITTPATKLHMISKGSTACGNGYKSGR